VTIIAASESGANATETGDGKLSEMRRRGSFAVEKKVAIE
jgi:hypothetical protein